MRRERIARTCVCCQSKDLSRAPAILMPFVAHRALGWEPVLIDPSWGLRTLQTGMAYSICNSLLCLSCGLLFLDLRFDEFEMASLYAGYRGPEYTQLRNHYEPGYALKNTHIQAAVSYYSEIERFLEPLTPQTPRVLDWGGDTGQNTPFRTRAEFVHIFDISQQPVQGDAQAVSRSDLKKYKYDLVVCSQVLEHTPFPLDVLGEIRGCLSPNTLLYLEVPFEELMRTATAPSATLAAKHHWHEHINFYSEEALRALLKEAGLKIEAFNILTMQGGGSATHVFQIACRLN